MVIKSWDEILYISEEFDAESRSFQYTMAAAIDTDEVMYYHELPLRKTDISLEHLTSTLEPICDGDVFPEWPFSDLSTTLTQAPAHLTTGRAFVKRPNMSQFDVFKRHNVTRLLAQGLLEEAQTMETLSKHPHPYIIRYHGCRRRRGHLTGIVLDYYSSDLKDYLKDHPRTVNTVVFMNALESAIRHLHLLGWAHNDLNPTNILINDSDPSRVLPVLIDFGSAREIGRALGTSRGTTGWIEGRIEDYCIAKTENDVFALEKIRSWLNNPVFDNKG